jgi:hypothetical protein
MKVILELSEQLKNIAKMKRKRDGRKLLYIFEAYDLNLPSIEFDVRRMMSLRDGTLKDLLFSSCSCLKKRHTLAICASQVKYKGPTRLCTSACIRPRV